MQYLKVSLMLLLITKARLIKNLPSILIDVQKLASRCHSKTKTIRFELSYSPLFLTHSAKKNFSVSELILSYIQTNNTVDDWHMKQVWLVSDNLPISNDALNWHFANFVLLLCYVICENFQIIFWKCNSIRLKTLFKRSPTSKFYQVKLGRKWTLGLPRNVNKSYQALSNIILSSIMYRSKIIYLCRIRGQTGK